MFNEHLEKPGWAHVSDLYLLKGNLQLGVSNQGIEPGRRGLAGCIKLLPIPNPSP